MSSSGPGFTNEFSFRREAPIVMVTFAYRLNNYKQKNNNNNGSMQEMEYNNNNSDQGEDMQ